MTLEEYISNPQGRSAVYTNKGMYLDYYENLLSKLLLKAGGAFKTFEYQDDKYFYIHVKVPSESCDNFFYDVIFQIKKKNVNLAKNDFKAFSNAPSFTFTFTYAFNKHNMLVDDAIKFASNTALKEKAKEKNPNSEIGYEKTLFLAYLYLKHVNKLSAVSLSASKKYSAKAMYADVINADKMADMRTEAGVEQRLKDKARKKQEEEAKKQKEKVSSPSRIEHHGTQSDIIKHNTIGGKRKSSINVIRAHNPSREAKHHVIKKK